MVTAAYLKTLPYILKTQSKSPGPSRLAVIIFLLDEWNATQVNLQFPLPASDKP